MASYRQTPARTSMLSTIHPQSNHWVLLVVSEVNIMTNDSVITAGTIRPQYTAVELMKLSRDERQRILEAAAVSAAVDYANERALTAFDAFGGDDLYDETG